MNELSNFESAFSIEISGNIGECYCGKVFYDLVNEYTWDDGEFEALEKDQNAIGVDHSVEYILFEGNQYVNACDCWVDRANKIIRFIKSHDRQIARFLNAERERKIREAELVEKI